MANVKKVTKKEMFEKLLALDIIATNEEFKNFIEHEIELLDKKNAKKAGYVTPAQKENMALSEIAFEKFVDGQTSSEIAQLLGLSSGQKALSVMSLLEKAGKVRKEKGQKGRTHFYRTTEDINTEEE